MAGLARYLPVWTASGEMYLASKVEQHKVPSISFWLLVSEDYEYNPLKQQFVEFCAHQCLQALRSITLCCGGRDQKKGKLPIFRWEFEIETEMTLMVFPTIVCKREHVKPAKGKKYSNWFEYCPCTLCWERNGFGHECKARPQIRLSQNMDSESDRQNLLSDEDITRKVAKNNKNATVKGNTNEIQKLNSSVEERVRERLVVNDLSQKNHLNKSSSRTTPTKWKCQKSDQCDDVTGLYKDNKNILTNKINNSAINLAKET